MWQKDIELVFRQTYWQISLRTNSTTGNTSCHHIFGTLENYYKQNFSYGSIHLHCYSNLNQTGVRDTPGIFLATFRRKLKYLNNILWQTD